MIETISRTGRALSDPNRVRILLALLEKEDLCLCDLTDMLGLAGATVSRHAAILLEAGLVEARKDGRWVHFRLSGREAARHPGIPPEVLDWIRREGENDPAALRDRKAIVSTHLCKE